MRMVESGDSGTGLGSSLTDLMTSLAVIFILLLVASHNNEQQKIEITRDEVEALRTELRDAKQHTETTRNTMLATLKDALATFAVQGVSAKADERDPLGLLVIIPDKLLAFAVNEAKIPQGGLDFLRSFAPRLVDTACAIQFKDQVNSIVVEGHTDSSGTDEINLPLSQARSMAVVRESLRILSGEEDSKPTPERRACFLHYVSATGRGSSDPICPEGKKPCLKSEEDRDRSRRVVFKIRVRSFEERQFSKTL
jgi:outer membrane protein OmpA-like peptidoglycan-associated protein